jgi:hypothetical protein
MKKVIHKVIGGTVNEAEERRFLCAYEDSMRKVEAMVRKHLKTSKNESK